MNFAKLSKALQRLFKLLESSEFLKLAAVTYLQSLLKNKIALNPVNLLDFISIPKHTYYPMNISEQSVTFLKPNPFAILSLYR